MNGIHDMGGMQGMGPIDAEKNEPVFHERWEARAYALNRAMAAWGKWNLDAGRHERELLPAVDYLRMSYYESWVARLEQLLVKSGLVTREEIETGKPAPGSVKATPPLRGDTVAEVLRKGSPAIRNVSVAPRFKSGQKVRARNTHPPGHTRLPRYARGKEGTVVRDYGVFVFPDTNAHFKGEKPQHLYSVRFSARELWGMAASPHDSIHIDMWEDYLDRA
jgi:nitrile hydratase subunit beta